MTAVALMMTLVTVTPSSLTFDGGGAFAEKTLQLRNDSGATMRIDKVGLAPGSDGFVVQPPNGRILMPGEAYELHVSYLPDAHRTQSFGAVQIHVGEGTAAGEGTVTGVPVRAGASWLLTLLVFFPLVGAALVLLAPRSRPTLVRAIALATSLVPLAAALHVVAHFDRGSAGLQFVQHVVWIPAFDVEYFVGVDGLSVTLLLLTALVSTIAVVASFGIDTGVRGYFALLLLLETGMLGTFVALDFFLFYIFWELMLVPMYFLIGIWGGTRREYAAIKFFLYTLVGSVLILLAIIALYFHAAPTALVDGTPVRHTFDMVKLAYANDWSAKQLTLFGCDFGRVVWVAFFIGFAIKIPVFPLHTWLPDAHVEAPTAVSVILAGVLLKMGTYGILRVNFAILPDATAWAATTMTILGAINIVYGGLCAFAQADLKRLVAYSSVSHMGFCLVGMASFSTVGLDGAMLQMFNHGTITALLFLLVGVLYDRAHTRQIDRFGGLAAQMPRYALVFGIAFFASLGLPGLSGFVGELLVFIGAFAAHRIVVALALFGVVVTAAYHLWALQRVLLGRWNEGWRDRAQFPDLTPRETWTLLPLVAIVVVLGFWPQPMLALVNRSVEELLRHVLR